MTAVISVPTYLAATVGGDLCWRNGGPVLTKECEHRTYFHVPLLLLWRAGPLYLRADVEVEIFRTATEACTWNERDEKTWERVH
jgi:aminopeptidase N